MTVVKIYIQKAVQILIILLVCYLAVNAFINRYRFSNMISIDIMYNNENYIVSVYKADADEDAVTEEYYSSAYEFEAKIKEYIVSSNIERIGFYAPYYDEIKQSVVLSALNNLRNSDVTIMLGNCVIPSEFLVSQRIQQFSVINCDVKEMSTYYVKDLRLTRCKGMKWDDLDKYKDLESLYIDIPIETKDNEAIVQGYYPDSFDVFTDHPTLKNIRFVIYSSEKELKDYDRTQVFEAGKTDGLESLSEYLPYSLDDLLLFIEKENRRIQFYIEKY